MAEQQRPSAAKRHFSLAYSALCELTDFLLAFSNSVVIALSTLLILAAIAAALVLSKSSTDSSFWTQKALLEYIEDRLYQQGLPARFLLSSLVVLIVLFPAVSSSIGYAARKKKSAWLMTVHATLLSVPLVILIALCVNLADRNTVLNKSMQSVQTTLNEEFVDILTETREVRKNFMSVTWNAWMLRYECCAMNNWTDFEQTNWMSTRDVAYNMTVTNASAALLIPIACCKVRGSKLAALQNVNLACQSLPGNQAVTNGLRGCKDKIEKLLDIARSFLLDLGLLSLLVNFLLWLAASTVAVYYWNRPTAVPIEVDADDQTVENTL